MPWLKVARKSGGQSRLAEGQVDRVQFGGPQSPLLLLALASHAVDDGLLRTVVQRVERWRP